MSGSRPWVDTDSGPVWLRQCWMILTIDVKKLTSLKLGVWTTWWTQTIKTVTRNTLDCDQSYYSSRIVFSHLSIEFGQTGNSAIRSPTPKTPSQIQTRSKSDDPPRRYRHFNFSRWRPNRHLGFGETGNSAIRSADPKNPTVEPNMKYIGRRDMAIWNFPKCEVGRSVGPQYICYIRNAACEE